jgi:hypothetical protein
MGNSLNIGSVKVDLSILVMVGSPAATPLPLSHHIRRLA